MKMHLDSLRATFKYHIGKRRAVIAHVDSVFFFLNHVHPRYIFSQLNNCLQETIIRD